MAKQLTERQRNSKKARKIKARQQWQYSLYRKIRSTLLLCAFFLAVALAIGFSTGEVQEQYASAKDAMHQTIADSGLKVEHIKLSGRARTGMAEVKHALGFDLGESILKVDLEALRERLEAIPTVKTAAVSRTFPNQLIIHLSERKPVAVWQHHGELKLIDELGNVITDLNLHQYKNLPLIVGKGAPAHVAEVMTMLQSDDELAKDVSSMVRVSDRRWDVHLKGGILIKLPEEAFEASWEKIATMNKEQQILLRHIEAIDMRNTERMYITVAPNKDKPELIPTKDT